MILILTASIMYWSLQQQSDESDDSGIDASSAASGDGEIERTLSGDISNLAINETASDPNPRVSSQVDVEE